MYMHFHVLCFVIIINFLVETGTRKIILTFVLMFHIRTMYYFTFIISKKGEEGKEKDRFDYHSLFTAEAACNASGLGFTGYNEKGVAQWDMVTGMNVIGVEFPVNSRELIASWNMMTATWLRRYASLSIHIINTMYM